VYLKALSWIPSIVQESDCQPKRRIAPTREPIMSFFIGESFKVSEK
jgi:hypothetical protein